MTVRLTGEGVILLEGRCPIDEAEPLQRFLLEKPDALVDWRASEHVHTAIVQLLLAFKPTVVGPCGAAFLRKWIEPALAERNR